MGFTPDEALITVDFTGTPLDGLHVKIMDGETDAILDLWRMSSAKGLDAAAVDALLDQVAEMIVEWDLEIPAGNPLPPTREVLGKRSLPRFTLPLVRGCIGALVDVGEDLGKGSNSGAPSLAALPMTGV